MMTATAAPRVYLAGPEVFLRDARQIGETKVALCRASGLTGLFPIDQELDIKHLPRAEQARRIAAANEQLMRSADAVIANLTPFRGVSADVGTAYEVGFMRALGKRVFGYSNASDDYHTRTLRFRRATPGWQDGDHRETDIEDFSLADNLMIECALIADGHTTFRGSGDAPGIASLSAFRACLAIATAELLGVAT